MLLEKRQEAEVEGKLHLCPDGLRWGSGRGVGIWGAIGSKHGNRFDSAVLSLCQSTAKSF